jgi:hypothetical protein
MLVLAATRSWQRPPRLEHGDAVAHGPVGARVEEVIHAQVQHRQLLELRVVGLPRRSGTQELAYENKLDIRFSFSLYRFSLYKQRLKPVACKRYGWSTEFNLRKNPTTACVRPASWESSSLRIWAAKATPASWVGCWGSAATALLCVAAYTRRILA